MPKITVHDLEKNEIIEREMTASELKAWQDDIAKEQIKAETQAKEQLAKAALLEKLGITEEEARLLLG